MTIYYCYKRNPDEIYTTIQTGLIKRKEIYQKTRLIKKLKRPASSYRIKWKATISKGTKATISRSRTIFSVYKTFMANLHIHVELI